MAEGNTEIAAGCVLGGVAVGEATLLGFVCPLCVVGSAVLIAAGGIRKIKARQKRRYTQKAGDSPGQSSV